MRKHQVGSLWRDGDKTFVCLAALGHKRGEVIGVHELRQLLVQDRQVPYEVWEVVRPGTAT